MQEAPHDPGPHVRAKMKSMLEGRRRFRGTITLAILLALASAVAQSTRPFAVSAASGRVIDLYTQKTPFNGNGANQSSDAFEPQELVILYANVTYNDAPVAQKLVSFQVNGPANPLQNVSAIGSATTDQDGIAQYSFRIPWPNENPEKKILGQWFAIATVSIADQTVVDTLTFQVGWIIRITNIETLNASLHPQTRFLRRETVTFNLTVENIAMTEKQATITVDVQDAAGHPTIHIEEDDLIFQPGTSYLAVTSQIPVTATLGTAIISASAYTRPPENGGVLYSPAISSALEIITRDVAITAVDTSTASVTSGETLYVSVTARNRGNETETFNVTAYYDNTPIGKQLVMDLAPQNQTNVIFGWNTTGTRAGTYVISAVADTVPGEIETADNTFVDGTVTITQPLSSFVVSPWMIFFFLFIIALIGSLALLLFLLGCRRRRRRRRPTDRTFTIIARPHL